MTDVRILATGLGFPGEAEGILLPLEQYNDTSMYSIKIQNPEGVQHGVASIAIDGKKLDGAIPLVSDGNRHEVIVTMGVNPRLAGAA